MPKLSEEEYILKAASLYGLSEVEIDALAKDFSGEVPNDYIRRRCKALFDLYEIYKSKEYNEHIDPDDDGLIILNDYAYKVSKRRLLDSKIGSGWIISSNLDTYLIVPPAEKIYDIPSHYNNIAEKNNFLIPQLARQLGIPATVYYKAEKTDPENGQVSYMRLTKNFITEDESLIRAIGFIKPKKKRTKVGRTSIDLDKLIEETTKYVKKYYKKHKIPEKEAIADCVLIRQGLIKQTIFNKLVFNNNEDNDQWGLIEDSNTHRLRLAPLFNYNYCANVNSTLETCTRFVRKSDRIEDIILRYSGENWFKEWVENDLVSLDLAQAEEMMERRTGETLTDEEREYYNFVIMEKMHSKVVGVTDLDYDTDKVQEELREDNEKGVRGVINKGIKALGFRNRNMPPPPPGDDEQSR